MENGVKLFPRSSAFELFLARVYPELWELRFTDPAMYVKKISYFVKTWLMTMYKDEISKKIPDFDARLDAHLKRIAKIKSDVASADALDKATADNIIIPEEEAEFASEVWHAVMDILTEAGFNAPIISTTSFFDPSGGKKSGTGRQEGFARVLPGKI